MNKYERQSVPVSSLQDGDVFELPGREDSICKVTYHRIVSEDDLSRVGIIGFDIVEGPLRSPWVHLPADFPVKLLLPTTTYSSLGGREWLDGLKQKHGSDR